jgi:hypothetical protein
MTDEQINGAIAPIHGWDMDPEEAHEWESRGSWVKSPRGQMKGRAAIPSYCNDLNAMHDAECHFKTATEQMQYAANVLKARGQGELFDENDLNVDHCWIARSATARQCAEAFLRTLGKWEESE